MTFRVLIVSLVLPAIAAGVLFFSSVGSIQAQAIPGGGFGGRLATPPVPCILNPGAFLVTVVGVKGGVFVYDPKANKPYAYGPPRNPGQSILGRIGPVPIPCHPGTAGFLMLFQGTSSV